MRNVNRNPCKCEKDENRLRSTEKAKTNLLKEKVNLCYRTLESFQELQASDTSEGSSMRLRADACFKVLIETVKHSRSPTLPHTTRQLSLPH